jgi:hypothetical protein
VDFTGAEVGRRFWVGGTIDRCTFESTKLTGTEFYRCLITDSVFATDLRDVVFDGTRKGMMKETPFPEHDRVPLTRVDFTGSRFFMTGFRSCAMEGITWPNDPKLHLITLPSEQVDRALVWLDAQGDRDNTATAKGLRRTIEDEASVMLPDKSRFIVINLAESETPPFTDDMEAALFGAGQRA